MADPAPATATATAEAPAAAPAPAPAGQPGRDQASSPLGGLWDFVSSATQRVTDAFQQAENSAAFQEVMHKGKELGLKVRGALDPMQGLRPTELKIVVGSLKPSKIMAVQQAAATVFPVSDVSVLGANVDSGVANQPVGFAAGQRGAENRIVQLLAERREDVADALLICMENFIVEIEGNWYDIACVILREEPHGLSLVTFSQAVRVPTKYVEAAREASDQAYERSDTGLQCTAGEMIHRAFPHVAADDWYGHVTNGHLHRRQVLEQCVVALLGEYIVEKRRSQAADPDA